MSSLNESENLLDLNIEKALLSSAIADPESLIELDDLKLSYTDFTDLKYQIVFSHIEKLIASNKPVDLVTISNSLNSNGDIYKIGGETFLTSIWNEVGSSANIRFYAEKVKDKSFSRFVLSKAKEIASFATSNFAREELIEQVNQLLVSINDNHESTDSVDMKTSVLAVIQSLKDKESINDNLTLTGFSAIDDKIVGLTEGQLIILAARPGMGKTSLALNIATNVSKKYDEPVLIFSLEMMHKELTQRLISMDSLVNSKKFKSLDFSATELSKVAKSAESCSKLKILIDDYSGSTIARIRNKSLRHKAKHGKLRLVVIDYLQLIPYQESKKGNKADDIGVITRSLKLLSKELGCPIICLSQLNRGVESRENKRPNLADLRDSGAIEQDADMVWFIYRDEVYNPDTKTPSDAEILISKNRSGDTGTAKLAWKGEFTKFTERAEDIF